MTDWVPIEDLKKHQRKEKVKGVLARIKRGLTPPSTPKQGGQKKGKSGWNNFFDRVDAASKNFNQSDGFSPKRGGKKGRSPPNDFMW